MSSCLGRLGGPAANKEEISLVTAVGCNCLNKFACFKAAGQDSRDKIVYIQGTVSFLGRAAGLWECCADSLA